MPALGTSAGPGTDQPPWGSHAHLVASLEHKGLLDMGQSKGPQKLINNGPLLPQVHFLIRKMRNQHQLDFLLRPRA